MKKFSSLCEEQINEFGLLVTGLIICAIPVLIRAIKGTIKGIDKKLGDLWEWTFEKSWGESKEDNIEVITEDSMSEQEKKELQKEFEKSKDLQYCPLPLTYGNKAKDIKNFKSFINLKNGAFYDLNKSFFNSQGFKRFKELVLKNEGLSKINESPYYPNYTVIVKMPEMEGVDLNDKTTKKNFKPMLIGGFNGISMNYFNDSFIEREKNNNNYTKQELDYLKNSLYIITFILNPDVENDNKLESVVKDTIKQYIQLCKKEKINKIIILEQKNKKINDILKRNFVYIKDLFEKREIKGNFKYNLMTYELNPTLEANRIKELGQLDND